MSDAGMSQPQSPDHALPPMGKYVLIYVPGRPWHDSDDPAGVLWKVAKRLPDRPCEPSNQCDYYWSEFGANRYLGQEVTLWCELPATRPVRADLATGTIARDSTGGVGVACRVTECVAS